MSVKHMVKDANRLADKAIRRSKIETMGSTFREWIMQPVVVYRLHLIIMTSLLFLFIGHEILNY